MKNAKAEALKIYRDANPRARRTGPTAIEHSGGTQTIYGCVCGSRHTVATRNRGSTKHEREWQRAHANCLLDWVARHACPRDMPGLGDQAERLCRRADRPGSDQPGAKGTTMNLETKPLIVDASIVNLAIRTWPAYADAKRCVPSLTRDEWLAIRAGELRCVGDSESGFCLVNLDFDGEEVRRTCGR